MALRFELRMGALQAPALPLGYATNFLRDYEEEGVIGSIPKLLEKRGECFSLLMPVFLDNSRNDRNDGWSSIDPFVKQTTSCRF